MTETINIDQLSPAQIEALQFQITKKQNKVLAEKKREKIKYEKERDKTITTAITQVLKLNEKMKEFKSYLSELMEKQHESLTAYGEIRSNSKGGFSIVSADGTMRVTRTRDTMPLWDERGTKAVAMLKEFLEETSKKRDEDLFKILMGFLAKNDKGDLEYSKVMDLLKHRDTFQDPRWTEGLDLLTESYNIHFRCFGYEFALKDAEGKWKPVSLNFTSL